MKTYRRVYDFIILPINGQDKWSKLKFGHAISSHDLIKSAFGHVISSDEIKSKILKKL